MNGRQRYAESGNGKDGKPDSALPRFAGVELTAETMQRTRQWFADNALACIAEAESGAVYVNDLPRYVAWRRQCIDDSLAGKGDHSFAFLQRAHFIQTGECVPLLTKGN